MILSLFSVQESVILSSLILSIYTVSLSLSYRYDYKLLEKATQTEKFTVNVSTSTEEPEEPEELQQYGPFEKEYYEFEQIDDEDKYKKLFKF